VQTEENAKAPTKVVNAQSDDQNHRNLAHPLKKRHLSERERKQRKMKTSANKDSITTLVT